MEISKKGNGLLTYHLIQQQMIIREYNIPSLVFLLPEQ